MSIIQNQVNASRKLWNSNCRWELKKQTYLQQTVKLYIRECKLKTKRKEFRAQGAEIAQKIRSTADKDVTVTLAEANKKSEIERWGDSQRQNFC